MDKLLKMFEDIEIIERINGSIEKDISKKDHRHLARNYRDLGKVLYKEGQYLYAIEYFDLAAQTNNNCFLYERELQDRLYKVEIYKMQNNQFDLANEYSAIGTLYKDKLNANKKAMSYFRAAALAFEREGNYFASHKLAYQAYLNAESIIEKRAMLNISIRSTIKQKLHQKVIFYIDELLKITDIDLGSHDYLSICMKGYYAAKKIENNQKVMEYLKPHIECHCQNIIEQEDIKVVTMDYLIAYIKCKGEIDGEVDSVINRVYKDPLEKSTVYRDLSSLCLDVGLLDDAGKTKVKSYECLKKHYLENKLYFKYLILSIWGITSKYGESLFRWSLVSLILISIFACLFGVTMNFWPNTFNIGANTSFFTYIYFSIVTFTTLGYGDILPQTILGQLLVIFEVISGYMMLGGIVSIFSKKVIR